VSEAEAGQKLSAYLARRLGRDLPGGLLMRLIRTGQVRVDGGRKKPFYRVQAGQEVRVPPIRLEERQKAAGAPLPLVHEDAELLAVDKPPGLPTHGGSGHEDSVAARLRGMYPRDDFTPTPAHRLDKDTGGLLLAARSYGKLRELQDLFAKRRVRKLYLALVAGRMEHGADFEMRDLLQKKGTPGREKMAIGEGQEAVALARCLEVRGETSLLRVELKTGRTHQIRVQLSSRGLPIIGDAKYGGPPADRLMLHAWRLELPGLVLECPAPEAIGYRS
jgi:23S rRNA pseudouridine955/2504/2580 synthase